MKNSAQEQISRKDFFALAFRKIKDTAVEQIVNTVEKVDEALDYQRNYQYICSLEDLSDDEPKQVIVKGKPYFCVKQAERIRLFTGLCPQDGFPLQFYKLQAAIGCPLCNSNYDLSGNKLVGQEQVTAKLPEFATKREEDKLFAGI